MIDDGWYKMHRGWMDHPALRDNDDRVAWIWLIEHAAFDRTTINISGQPINLERGELSYSIRYMAEALSVSKKKVETMLARFEKWELIGKKKGTAWGTGQGIISICNYSQYQGELTNRGQLRGQQGDSKGTNKKELRNKELRNVLNNKHLSVGSTPPEEVPHQFLMPNGSLLSFAELFERFWINYPSIRDKGHKGKARDQLLAKINNGVDYAHIGRGITKFKRYCEATGEKQPDMFRWLRDEGYERDYPIPTQQKGSKNEKTYPTRSERANAALDRAQAAAGDIYGNATENEQLTLPTETIV